MSLHPRTGFASILLALVAAATVSASERLDPLLFELANAPPARARALAASRRVRMSAEATPSVLAVVETRSRASGAILSLQVAGLRVEQTADDVALAWIPLNRLSAVAALAEVSRVRRPIPAVWSVVSEGVRLIGADLTQSIGARGEGVRIGVLDVFSGYPAKVGRELPPAAKVHFASFIAGGEEGSTDHGVRVAEILHDVAPDAELYFAAFEDDVGYRNAVAWLLSQGVHVINHSGGFGLYGDLSGNGPLHPQAAAAAAANVLYVEAVGNSGRSHYRGRYSDGDGDGFHDFAAGVSRMPFTVSSQSQRSVRVDLAWDDWGPNPVEPRPLADYDVCIFDGASELVCTKERQDGGLGQTPFEVLEYELPSTGGFTLGIRRAAGSPDLDFDLVLLPDFDLGALAVASSSFITPADSPYVFAVGASGLSDIIRSYSSRGPTGDGRIKPDIVAPDGVNTSLGVFFGSSAACPHVAGAAALLKSLEPGLSAVELAERMRSRAVLLAGDTFPGPDNVYGSGRVDANFRGLAPLPTPTPTPSIPGPAPRSQGGCRLVDPGAAGGALGEVALLFTVLGYAAWLRLRA